MTAELESVLAGVRVLLVDDDDDGRDLMATMLEHAGAVVVAAANAAEAFDAFVAEPPRLLLSDIALPGEDGFSLLRRIRAVEAARGGEVIAVAISGYGHEVAANAGGFAVHLTKPVERLQLLRILRALLDPPPSSPSG